LTTRMGRNTPLPCFLIQLSKSSLARTGGLSRPSVPRITLRLTPCTGTYAAWWR